MNGRVNIDCGVCVLREWREDDIERLPALANDWDIAGNMRDSFPYPYERKNAEIWVRFNLAKARPENFAIEVDGELAGAVGCLVLDGERRGCAEVGYWIARKFWGRGLATAACRALTEYLFERCDLRRLEAHAHGGNLASQRVLEKSGFRREGILRAAVIKGGEVRDVHLFGKLRDESSWQH